MFQSTGFTGIFSSRSHCCLYYRFYCIRSLRMYQSHLWGRWWPYVCPSLNVHSTPKPVLVFTSAHQISLSFLGLEQYVLHSHRTNLFSANKEGFVSLTGTFCCLIYCVVSIYKLFVRIHGDPPSGSLNGYYSPTAFSVIFSPAPTGATCPQKQQCRH